MLFLLLLLLLAMTVHTVVSGDYTDIYGCTDSNSTTSLLYFPENMNFTICCKLKDELCKTASINDTLTLNFEKPESNTDQELSRLDTCSVKLEVYNASPNIHQGKYYCKLRGEAIDQESVYIIKKPTEPTFISFVCTPNKVITVTFVRDDITKEYTDECEITMMEYRYSTPRKVIMCNETHNVYKCVGTVCTCEYRETSTESEDRLPADITVTIEVNLTRIMHVVQARRNFSVMANILPDPLVLVTLQNVSSHDALIQFCALTPRRTMISMYAAGKPLIYHLYVIKTEGVPEILNVSLPSKHTDTCMQANILSLESFTKYTVIVSNSGGGGESNRSRLDFTTNKTVPVHPPIVDEFGYQRLDNVIINGSSTRVLLITWKPLTVESAGGDDLSYFVELAGSNGFKENRTSVEPYAAIIRSDLPTGPFTAKIWAQNTVGISQEYTTLEIPQNAEMPAVYIEMNGDKVLVSIRSVPRRVVLSIHWCNNFTDKEMVTICQEYPKAVSFFMNRTAEIIIQTEFSIIADDRPRETAENRTLQYSSVKYINCLTSSAEKTIATVTKNPNGKIQEMLNYVFYTGPGSDYDYSGYYGCDEFNRRKRTTDRGVPVNKVVRKMRDKTYREPVEINKIVYKRSVSSASAWRFFTSMKTEDGRLHTGMFPVQCYFDRIKTKVSLTVWYTIEGDSALLQWRQECNTGEPSQFLAASFKVFSSIDEHCDDIYNVFVGEARNNVFEQNTMKLPPGVKFACIKAYKSISGESEFSVKSIEYPSVVDSINLVVVIPVVVAVIVVIGILILGYWCYQRKQHTMRLQTMLTLPTKASKTTVPDCDREEAVPDLPVRTDISPSTISVNTEDSGRGTEPNNSGSSERISDKTLNETNPDPASGESSYTPCKIDNGDSDDEASDCMDSGGQKEAFKGLGLVFHTHTSGSSCSNETEGSSGATEKSACTDSSNGDDQGTGKSSHVPSEANDCSDSGGQNIFFNHLGLVFHAHTIGSSCSDETEGSSGATEKNACTDSSNMHDDDANVSKSTDHSRFSSEAENESSHPAPHINSLNRYLSSGSESDESDSAMPLIRPCKALVGAENHPSDSCC